MLCVAGISEKISGGIFEWIPGDTLETMSEKIADIFKFSFFSLNLKAIVQMKINLQ